MQKSRRNEKEDRLQIKNYMKTQHSEIIKNCDEETLRCQKLLTNRKTKEMKNKTEKSKNINEKKKRN